MSLRFELIIAVPHGIRCHGEELFEWKTLPGFFFNFFFFNHKVIIFFEVAEFFFFLVVFPLRS